MFPRFPQTKTKKVNDPIVVMLTGDFYFNREREFSCTGRKESGANEQVERGQKVGDGKCGPSGKQRVACRSCYF